MRGDKQDNMVESDDYADPHHGIPVFSLYGENRRPRDDMMQTFERFSQTGPCENRSKDAALLYWDIRPQ